MGLAQTLKLTFVWQMYDYFLASVCLRKCCFTPVALDPVFALFVTSYVNCKNKRLQKQQQKSLVLCEKT